MPAKHVEIMAPVGSFESLRAAIDAGAGSVYFGVTQLNMRAGSAANFNLEDLKEITSIAHEHNVKTYLTVNTLLYNDDLELVKKLIDTAKKSGVSAVICADMAAILYANSIKMPVHISTQLSVSNIESVKFYSQYAETVVLARELDLPMIQSICEQVKKDNIMGNTGKLLEIEIFVHGALCIANSGRCTMSLFVENSSANRGTCKQICRRAYDLVDKVSGEKLTLDNNFILSPADLCCIDFLDRIVASGVSILKIEGRGRSADYVSKVVKAYREAVDAVYEGTYTPSKVEVWLESLKSVYNRGLSSGWYLGRPVPELSKAYGSKATIEKIYTGKVLKYFPKAKVAEALIEAFPVKSTDEICIMGPKSGYLECALSGMRNSDEKPIKVAKQKDIITFSTPSPVYKNDKIYIRNPHNL